jgi:hypothetical protein
MSIKNILKRTQYLVYYCKKLDWTKFKKFFGYVKSKKGWSSFHILGDTLKCVYQYNIGIMDYFILRFFEKSPAERDLWVGTGFKYEYDLIMNPKSKRHLLENKIHFYEAYKPFVRHATCTINDIQNNNVQAQKVLNNPTGKIVVKDSFGQCGWDVEILKSLNFNRESLLKYMKSKRFNLAEEFIIQHPELARLSDSGVNTIRIITQLNKKNEVDILGARLRVSVNNHVDNLASGNMAAAIDLKTGKVIGPGIFSDITKNDVTAHPVSGIILKGFQIPMWEECITMVTKAALHRPENRSIGWDVVITEKGPELLEGNHNWCKILWQLPVNIGLKKTLEQYLSDFQKKSVKT